MEILKKILDVIKPLIEFISELISKVIKIKSIRTKLISAFLVPVILLIVLGIISYFSASGAVKNIARESTISTMDSSGKYLEIIYSMIDDLTFQLFSEKDIQDYLSSSAIDYEDSEDMYAKVQLRTDVDQRLTNLSSTNKFISQLFLYGNEDKSIYPTTAASSKLTLESMQETEIFKKAQDAGGRIVWAGIHKEIDSELTTNNSQATKNYSISAIRQIKSMASGVVIGLLVIDLKMDTIQDFISGINLGKNGEVHLVSPDGRDVNNILEDDKKKNIVNLSGEQFYQNILASDELNGSGEVRFKGNTYLMSYSKIAESGYVLIGLIPTSELVASAKQIIATTIIFVLLAAMIAFFTGMLISNSMSRTINRIITASGRAASGDLTVNLVSRRQDELGVLTKSINSMITSMRRLIEQASIISKKVAESSLTVTSTSQQVSVVSHDISRAIQEISQGASSQAQDAEQGVQRIGSLANMINDVTDNARSIDSLTKDTMDMTHKGLSSIEDLDKKANETTIMSKEILINIQELDSHSKSIGKIVKVISSIADQTNLLALNATIEAARAGEMGKGFAVVADEVRKLAEQSMNATREIASIIKSTQNQTAKAVEKAVFTEEILKSQNEAVVNTVHVFKSIKISMETLAVQVEQIMSRIVEMAENKEYAINSIQNISAVSEETAASSEEVTASTQEQLSSIEELSGFAQTLGEAAKELEESIAKFTID